VIIGWQVIASWASALYRHLYADIMALHDGNAFQVYVCAGEVIWLLALHKGNLYYFTSSRAVRACCKLAFVLVEHIGQGASDLPFNHL
jgi:hypothetical protein